MPTIVSQLVYSLTTDHTRLSCQAFKLQAFRLCGSPPDFLFAWLRCGYLFVEGVIVDRFRVWVISTAWPGPDMTVQNAHHPLEKPSSALLTITILFLLPQR